MNFFASICFVSALLSTFVGIFVLLVNKKSKLHQAWFFFNLVIAIWITGLGFTMLVGSKEAALIFQKVLYVGTILIPVYFVHFSSLLVGEEEKAKKTFRINLSFAVFFLILLFFTDLFVKGVKERTVFGYWPFEAGFLYYLFLIWFAVLVLYGFFILRKGYRNEKLDIIQRQQICFMFYGALIGFSAGSLNFLLDFNIVIPPYYNFFLPFYFFFVGYAIVTKQLFGIKVILIEILVVIIAILLLVNTLFSTNVFDYFWKGMTFVLFLVFGYYLIKATHREVRQKEILEEKVKERTKELEKSKDEIQKAYEEIKKRKEKLERVLKAVVGRELRMIELKKEIKKREEKIKEMEEELKKSVSGTD